VARFHLLRVFCEARDTGGNRLAVFLEGAEVPPHHRQRVAAELELSETVFVDDAAGGVIRIFTPRADLHPAVCGRTVLDDVREHLV